MRYIFVKESKSMSSSSWRRSQAIIRFTETRGKWPILQFHPSVCSKAAACLNLWQGIGPRVGLRETSGESASVSVMQRKYETQCSAFHWSTSMLLGWRPSWHVKRVKLKLHVTYNTIYGHSVYILLAIFRLVINQREQSICNCYKVVIEKQLDAKIRCKWLLNLI